MDKRAVAMTMSKMAETADDYRVAADVFDAAGDPEQADFCRQIAADLEWSAP